MKKFFKIIMLFSLMAVLLAGGSLSVLAAETQTGMENVISTPEERASFAGFKGNAKSFEASPAELDELLSNARIAVLDASLSEQEVRKMYPDATVQVYASYPDLFTALSSGKVDYVVTQDNICSVYLNNDSRYQYATSEVFSSPDHLAVKKGNTELLDKINAVLKKYNEDGTTQEIIDKWISGNYSVSDIPE